MSAYTQVEFGKSSPSRIGPRISRTGALYAIFGMLAFTNVITAVALFMASDITKLFDSQDARAFSAYEERILQLRMEVDRLHSRQYRQDGDLNLQMQELTQQQEFLSEQHRYVRILAEKAAALGLDSGDFEIASAEPELPVMVTGSLINSADDEVGQVQQIADSIDTMLSDSRLALAAISDSADQSTGEIVDGLKAIGIRLSLDNTDPQATGGPFIPASDGMENESLAESANGVLDALARFQQAREGLSAAPIHYPFATRYRLSSGFGNRNDPFGGGSAFHSGLDFAAPSGTSVLAAGDGRVTFAGRKNGYGNVVEITHFGGTLTRYAHLSAILVSEGTRISSGDLIARVGSTGRSTGPHLHFEVRRNDAPQNPTRYLDLSRTLSNYLL